MGKPQPDEPRDIRKRKDKSKKANGIKQQLDTLTNEFIEVGEILSAWLPLIEKALDDDESAEAEKNKDRVRFHLSRNMMKRWQCKTKRTREIIEMVKGLTVPNQSSLTRASRHLPGVEE